MPDDLCDVTNSLNSSGGMIEESVRSLKIPTDGKEDKTGSIAYPDQPEEQDCAYYLRTGICGYGDKCKFNHPTNNLKDNNQHGVNLPERDGEPDCAYFIKTGTCVFGSTCKYNHPRDRHGASPVLLSTVGLPMRQGQESCSHYLRTGSCKFGVGCKFHHPQPVVYASGPSYLSLQTHVPVIIPSLGPTQAWGPYIGNMSPVLSTNGLTSVDHVNPSTKCSQLPVRPDEPECRYYMNTGTCKYASSCKYHHPLENMVKYDSGRLGPLGLPLRHGQPICWYYSLYGTCNYGAGCKYDHPLTAYSYNQFNGLTTLQMVDSSLLLSGVMNSYDSSPLKSFKNPSLKSDKNSLKNPSPKSENISLKNSNLKSEEIGNVKLGTDDSSGEYVGSSHV